MAGCASQAPEIYSLCQRDGIGNYVIKWETTPQMNGQMELLVSDSPDMFHAIPAGHADIRDGVMTYVTNDNISRKYFRLSFDNTYEQMVASRLLLMDSVQNFRDMGGYISARGKSIRWGKVFRSGAISRISDKDRSRLDRLKIKTIIDLRSKQEVRDMPVDYPKAEVINIPIISDANNIFSLIMEGKVRKGDGLLFMQDLYLQYITANEPAFAEALNLFLDEDNYPILFNCSMGKDRSGILAALLLAALDMPEEIIFSDYMATNDCLDIRRYANFVKGMDADAQEALTVVLSADETFLDVVFRKIKKEYGSVPQYLSKGMQLTDKRREKLKDILLF
ncbi:MAG: tyrosine-protein phosphatase [Tannerellaceae bacterium]|jgi:protein-tyrosine phosphatase|nr:tyrosine-protein phosphatase [Tannerellaceae bacterium]